MVICDTDNPAMVNQVIVVTYEVMTSTLQLGNLKYELWKFLLNILANQIIS
jgi:hypothetical protein